MLDFSSNIFLFDIKHVIELVRSKWVSKFMITSLVFLLRYYQTIGHIVIVTTQLKSVSAILPW